MFTTAAGTYGDNFASLGSGPASAAGQYLLQFTDSCCDGYEGCITAPTPIGTLLVRVEVKNNGTDLTHVDSYLSKSTLVPINPRTPSDAALTMDDFANLSNTTAAAVPAILALAGICNGSYSQPASINLTLASALANASASAFTNAPSSYPTLGNGWSCLNNSYSGTFDSGTAIVPRALIAASLYLQNTADQALYPTLGSTQLSLTDKEAYLFTFSGKPPLADDGFWSLTMYNDAGWLVANKENTYAVGDRSNITFPNGDLVYGNGTKDGSFQVLVQDAEMTPPNNWTTNWLPAPPGGGSFTVTFRLYAPTTALSDGSYVYPVVTKVIAITA
ncbi:hypothetical protein LTR65_004653 [Meristemomyces frigidus]